MHLLSERSPLSGFNEPRTVDADARIFLTFAARDPTLATKAHDIHTYGPTDIRFGRRYVEAVTVTEHSRLVAALTTISALVPDIKDHPESGWTDQGNRHVGSIGDTNVLPRGRTR